MVYSRTPGQQINPFQRAKAFVLETDVHSGILGNGGGRGRGVRSVDVGVEDPGGIFGTIGRGGDDM